MAGAHQDVMSRGAKPKKDWDEKNKCAKLAEANLAHGK